MKWEIDGLLYREVLCRDEQLLVAAAARGESTLRATVDWMRMLEVAPGLVLVRDRDKDELSVRRVASEDLFLR